MNLDYYYWRRRESFGRPCQFADDGPDIIDYVPPDKTLSEKYVPKAFIDRGTQDCISVSVNEVNTPRADYSERGMFHEEGGWPKDLNILDEEAVLRFRKKLAREENYIASMRVLSKPIEHAILQNNAINIYEKYFEGIIRESSVPTSLSRIQNIYREPNEEKRPVSYLSWSPIGGDLFAASYCDMNFQPMVSKESTAAYIWNVELSNSPQTILDCGIPIVSLEWNPLDKFILIGGMFSGQITFFDLRKGSSYVDITPDTVCHREPVHSVLWTNSKTGCEFFSTSSDGIVKWWDWRNLSKFTDSMVLDLSRNQDITLSHGASCLEYDSNVPAKYLVGTESGHVICGNRKGLNMSEKIPWIMKTHFGPVFSVHRNAFYSKCYMTVGDWSARIWSEDCKESAIMWTKHYKVSLTGGEWSKSRYSVFLLTRSDGYLDLWDLLMDQKNPLVSVKITDRTLTTLRIEDQGQLAVVGDDVGKCYLVQYSETLATNLKNDKNLLSTMFDRESRREKILETRMKEIKLAMRLKALQAEGPKPTSKTEVIDDRQEDVLKAEEDYWYEVYKALGALEEAAKKTEENELYEDEDEDIEKSEEEEEKEEELEPTEGPEEF